MSGESELLQVEQAASDNTTIRQMTVFMNSALECPPDLTRTGLIDSAAAGIRTLT
jgi:hypothetical protein